MSSHLNNTGLGYEQRQPHAPRDAPFPSPLRRQNGLHPPTLSMSIPSGQPNSNYSTPLSSVSHQSPFTLFTSSSINAPVGNAMASSLMAPRGAQHVSMPYDPRDWAPGTDSRVAQVQRARGNAGEDGLVSPPPPYSPEIARQSEAGGERPQILSQTQSPPAVSGGFSPRQPNSRSHVANRHSIHVGSYVPPPPVVSPPMPRPRIASDMQNGYDPATYSMDINGLPPAARRSASASAEMSRATEIGSNRSTSRQRTWVQGMPLPGPPPGPPPAPSTRSQSTSGAIDRPAFQSRPRPIKQTMYASDLGPVPPTPATWTEGESIPDNQQSFTYTEASHHPNSIFASPATMHSDDSFQSLAAGPNNTQVEPLISANPPASSLSRSSAIRDNSAKGLRERRAQNRNSKVFDNDFDPISVQTNPWADAMKSDGTTSQHDTPLASAQRSGRTTPKPSPLIAVMSTDDQTQASRVQFATPPLSPDPSAQQRPTASRSAGLPSRTLPTPPLTIQTPASAYSYVHTNNQPQEGSNSFQRDAVQRHTEFLEKETAAGSDLQRLQLFADFILREASLRQKKYEAAFSKGGFDVEQLRHDLFRASLDTRSASDSISQASADECETMTGTTMPQTRPETMWWKDYHPALSPILSQDNDEMSSRGRAPSRWWESQTGSQSGGQDGRAVPRSKRESKYMGLSKEFLMSHSPSEEHAGSFAHATQSLNESVYPKEKANPETFGYFDGDAPPTQAPVKQTEKPATPALLDISRFITLPPPYPRHHPAVNNSHPDLVNYRNTVRTLGELDEVQNRKSNHKKDAEVVRGEHKRRLSDSRRTFRSHLQTQVAEGAVSYTEAAEAEEAFKASEFDMEKQFLQSEFDTLQDRVINPLHEMLRGRITQLDTSIEKLLNDLHTDARYQDPDQPQEEGDEKPELLEKLTQLKWLFDVREQIHRECFELLSERNDKFKSIVLLPYHYSRNVDKLHDTEAFCDKDARDRVVAHGTESLKRHEVFYQTIDQHVRRGVELQSSAFWDIAPGLLDLLQKIPEDLRDFQGILIPEKEYKENPSYNHHPQQYLYSLLSHAEKSTYQFIEGQVNLQCLLHEAKSALVSSKYRVLEASGACDVSDSKSREEATLTAELKQKASMIEEQWLEALGSQLQATRERVKALLQKHDGWDDMAAEDE